MLLDTTTLRKLYNTRVTLHLLDGAKIIGPLRGVTDEKVFIQSELSVLSMIEMSAMYIKDVESTPLICTECRSEQINLFDGGRCAPCYRDAVRSQPPSTTPCDECGADNAFRNPKHRKSIFLCGACHRKLGESIPLVQSVAGLIADCRTYDVMDPRHDMQHVRGNQFACTRCRIKVHSPELRKQMVVKDLPL